MTSSSRFSTTPRGAIGIAHRVVLIMSIGAASCSGQVAAETGASTGAGAATGSSSTSGGAGAGGSTPAVCSITCQEPDCCLASDAYGGPSGTIGVASVALDAQGTIFIGGSYTGAAVGPAGPFSWQNGSVKGMYVAAVGDDGAPRWQRDVAANGADVEASWVGRSGGAVVVAGTLSGDADPGCGTIHGGKGRSFLLLLSPETGACVSAAVLPTPFGTGLMLDDGDFVLAGHMYEDADLGCGPISAGGSGGYVTRRRGGDGSCVWSRAAPGILWLAGTAMAVDASSAIYVGGSLEGTSSFGGATLKANAPAGGGDALLLKFGSDGSELWGRNWGNAQPSVAFVTGVAVTADQRPWIAGTFQGEITLGTQTFGTPMGPSQLFLAGTTPSGDLDYAAALSNPSYAEDDVPLALAADRAGALYLEAPLAEGPLQVGGSTVSATSGTLLAKLDVSAGLVAKWTRVLPAVSGDAFTVDLCGDLLMVGTQSGVSNVGCGSRGAHGQQYLFWGRFGP